MAVSWTVFHGVLRWRGLVLRGQSTAWNQCKASVNVRVWSRALSITRNSIKGFRFRDHCVSSLLSQK
jgi:hypothetical protein